jgi:hypothetical protein
VSIREIREPSTLATLAGALGGALIGGVAGANVGGGSGQIGSPHIASGGILSANIASGQVSSAHFASGTIMPNQITSGGVRSGMLGNGAVVSFITPSKNSRAKSAAGAGVGVTRAAKGTPSWACKRAQSEVRIGCNRANPSACASSLGAKSKAGS